ncbi:agenet domain-containing protein [Thalictrum thalictroides]|uniref:Agenet domain-containing protein n=1 Tax=Thalictrum thalictroides TaxID=46969 RepID=A0A7J6WB55_THATH|nr:agenet domain-containing protein [Thalictrum thalictroides]
MKWKFKFIKGQEVEVTSTNKKEEGLEDSFFAAKIISISNQKKKKNKFCVEYKTLLDETDETKPLREYLPYKCLRPVPPPPKETSPPCPYELNEEVDAFCNDGWWKGVITKIPNVDSSKYSVFFKHHDEEMEFECSDLRNHLDWIDVKWVSSKNKETAVLEQYDGSFLIPIPTGCSAYDSDMDISETPPSEMMNLPSSSSLNKTRLPSHSVS